MRRLQPARVTWWLGRGPGPETFLDLFVDPFNAKQDAVRLDLRVLEVAPEEQIVRALEAGNGPDIVMVPRAGDFLSLAQRGYLLDLAAYADRYGWRGRLLAPASALASADERMFGIPRSSETMFLLSNSRAFRALGMRPPRSLPELEAAAGLAFAGGLLPFGAGSADYPQTCEFLWTLVVNHHAGPAAVRSALRGDFSWTSTEFVDAVDYLRSWFDRGWFGDRYFEETISQGLARVVEGAAVMAPAMTGMLPEDCSQVDATPFPSLRQEVAEATFVFGTASLLGINAASAQADGAARVLDALFAAELRRRFTARVPGDWNLPLATADAEGLRAMSPAAFAEPAIGLTEAVHEGRYGFATWSFFPPEAEAWVIEQFRPLVEGRITAREHLAGLQSVFTRERQRSLVPRVPD
ncbi:ABC transporter substrate-binding protein [Streptomyces sp. NPDC093676]|uniref:ABC transporter substrate-binding protein n=1 Tax=Streptomyces sp. NPDC093676 TaxID=3366050 RepID=UPI0038007FF9